MRPAHLATAALVLGLAGCAQKPKPAPVAAAPVPAAAPRLAGNGPPGGCVPIRSIQDATVRSDRVIDFRMIDGVIYRNRLAQACPQLGFERAFSYATSLSQLCSVDIIRVLVQGGGPRFGASCGLGRFTAISAEAAKAPLAPEDR